MDAQDIDRTGTGGRGPNPPPWAPSDWGAVVHDSAWPSIARLGIWTGGGTSIGVGQDPSPYFAPVSPGSLGQGATPAPIYVVVHGWAPGFRSVVEQAAGRIHWWSSAAQVSGRWASDWCWAPVAAVDPTGVVQQIEAFRPGATVLAYSWIDDSATDSGILNMTEVYRSEAYTHLNGLRLADALQQAITPSFFANGGQVHLIGHSHGSRVGTVAAMALQEAGHPPAGLAILDSPEGETPLLFNGANLLGVYLDRMAIQDPTTGGPGTYVDSYASYFGVTYSSARAGSPVEKVVEVALAPGHIYGSLDPSDCHTYAAAWYGGAADGAARAGDPPVGLAWPPAPSTRTPALNQRWAGGDQWTLTAGASAAHTYVYGTHALTLSPIATQGQVTVRPDEVVLRPAGPAGAYSVFHGKYWAWNRDQYGIAFTLEWPAPQPGGVLVVAAGNILEADPDTLLVLDGGTTPAGTATPIAVNTTVWGEAEIYVYFLGDAQRSGDAVRLKGFRWVEVGSAHRLGAEARRTAIPSATEPR